MVNVVGVKFLSEDTCVGKMYYFGVNELDYELGQRVFVDTSKGLEYCEVVTNIVELEKSKIVGTLKYVKKKANENDYQKYLKNIKDSKEIILKVRELVEQHKLEMIVINAEYTFNRDQLLIKFLSDNRVDFRNLVKDIASIYKTRIELRQVGIRDEAKTLGGLGICGRVFCCTSYLSDFTTVSINMAKNQSLSLIPSKINGACGRLLCCLVYEDQMYRELKKDLPDLGSMYDTDHGRGKIISMNVLTKVIRVNVKDYGIVEVDLNGSN